MIRIGYMSDLHLEFERGRHFAACEPWLALREARAAIPGHPELGPLLAEMAGAIDVMVLAGDIDNGVKGIRYAGEVAEFLEVPVVYLAGNHEHYGQVSLGETLGDLRAAAETAGVHVLERDRVDLEIGNRRLAVLGATLWTDYRAGEPRIPRELALELAQDRVSDHGEIHVDRQREFSPCDALAAHEEAHAWLMESIPDARREASAILVATHHAPILRAARLPRLQGIEWAYASDLEHLVAQIGRGAWIYGHTHDEARFEVAGLPVVTAARGYVSRAWGWDFRPGIVEI